MTIINIRGTSGSGKSTVARRVMELYRGNRLKYYENGRKQPIGYTFHRGGDNKPGRSLSVVGHYETTCGGCDTINSMDRIFELVRLSHRAGNDVLFEGLLLSAEVQRMAALHEDGLPAHVVVMDVPLDVCLASVNGRRQAAYEERTAAINAENMAREEAGRKLLPLPEPKGPVNPANTESKWKGTQMSARRLQERGVSVCTADRDAALAYIRSLLEV